ncbi:Protein N-methyltransferase NNT1 [Tolypocladium ophioglossoides CBS 100239]|uniref:Protein N-methyltransferase NNT1 n=1 Tax=Tolypocladium ophioglossoides (strain CBS 100239) TaxID=1163406 RepID=A0A0L0N333_TOLOC|nr:Protein N-methyltransferase NNT1 [Tolypocladium ophioglossoides CBS 100239]
MALTSRISLGGDESADPEDFLSTSLGVVFPDDATNQHGDAGHRLVYTSPHLRKPLLLDLADPVGEVDRGLFSHFLWNASLLLAELVERDTLGVGGAAAGPGAGVSFHVGGKAVLELGAGAALPSMMAGLLGARRVVVTDYPAVAVLTTLAANIARNIQPALSPPGAATTPASSILVRGHSWGELPADDAAFCQPNRHAFDRVLVADCLWMPWQHANLHRSVGHFLAATAEARCWIVAGFHTGRGKMRGFFAAGALRAAGLALERIWERDCDGVEREWSWDREDDATVRKRWLVVAVLKRAEGP